MPNLSWGFPGGVDLSDGSMVNGLPWGGRLEALDASPWDCSWVLASTSCVNRVKRSHWGQGMVSWGDTLQVHCKEMDKVPSQYPSSTSKVHSELSSTFRMCHY